MRNVSVPEIEDTGNSDEMHNELEVCDKIIKPIVSVLNKNAASEFCNTVGNGTTEIIGKQLILNPYHPYLDFFGVRKANRDYIKKELDWYLSEDLSIKGHVDDVKIWQTCATKDNKQEINSNYGWCVFSIANGSQYDNCLERLRHDKLTREAIIMYNRPSIQVDATRDGMHDMICTFDSQFMIRDNRLIMIHNMRSNDLIFGFLSDWPWTCFVYQNMYHDLLKTYPDLEKGMVMWTSNSMHVYERHYDVVRKIYDMYSKYTSN